jgi:hypothetical protein
MSDTFKVWMYYRTDGDSGYYAIKLFRLKTSAEAWAKVERSAYGKVAEVEVHP